MAITTDYQFSLKGLLMGAETNIGLTEVLGLDLPDIDMAISQRSAAHGAYTTARYTKERVITFQGRLRGTMETLPTLILALKTAFAPVADDVELEFKLPGMGSQFVYVKPHSLKSSIKAVETTVGYADFIGTLVAGDPRIFSTTAQSALLSAPGGATGAAFPMTFPVAFSVGATSGISTLVNNGTVPALPVITLTGPLVNPKVVNGTTGTMFQSLLALGAGDTITVDSVNRTVLLNGSASRYTNQASDSVFLELAPGSNAVYVTTDSGSGTATVAWRDTWM